MKVLVSNIQRFCLHDGPGIRTTVFFKGCNLRCPWCNNPENINFEKQEYENGENKGVYGKEYSLEELEEIILKDKDYYENGGGITFSGGECLLQFEKIEPLLKNLKKENINICIETALNVPKQYVELALKYVDEFYIDMKIVNKEDENLIGENSQLYLKNLKDVLNETNKVTIRIPIVPKYTYTQKNIEAIIEILKQVKIKNLEIFKIHRLGKEKYKNLGLNMPKFDEISEKEINELKIELQKYVNNVKIIKL